MSPAPGVGRLINPQAAASFIAKTSSGRASCSVSRGRRLRRYRCWSIDALSCLVPMIAVPASSDKNHYRRFIA
jgi:hypothetical protein